MKSQQWIYIIALAALVGLSIIQVTLLGLSIQLEQRRLNYKMEQLCFDFEQIMLRETHLGKAIADLATITPAYYLLNKDSLRIFSNNRLQFLTDSLLAVEQISIDYSIALSDQYRQNFYLKSVDFETVEQENQLYVAQLGNNVFKYCGCTPLLLIKVNRIWPHLLRSLYPYIIPSAVFVTLLIGCIFLLGKTIKEQRQLDQVKNDFINNLTHELKTPVFSIGLATNVLQESIKLKDFTKATKLIQLIDGENNRLKKHIDLVLELASLENGQYAMETQSVEIDPLLKKLAQIFQLKVNTQGGHFNYELNSNNIRLNIDPNHFSNAVQNLLENALKYNQPPIDIFLQTKVKKDLWVLTIKDNGIGVPSQHISKIFDKFFRVSQGDLHPVKGFGLGLSYVKTIIHMLGGKVSVQSQEGIGSSFFISFEITT